MTIISTNLKISLTKFQRLTVAKQHVFTIRHILQPVLLINFSIEIYSDLREKSHVFCSFQTIQKICPHIYMDNSTSTHCIQGSMCYYGVYIT